MSKILRDLKETRKMIRVTKEVGVDCVIMLDEIEGL